MPIYQIYLALICNESLFRKSVTIVRAHAYNEYFGKKIFDIGSKMLEELCLERQSPPTHMHMIIISTLLAGGGVICPDRVSSGSPRVARGPKFKIPFPRSCVPRPVEPKFHRRRPSGLGALRVLKLLTPRG